MSKNERRFGNEDDSKNESGGSNDSKDAAALVEQEHGQGDHLEDYSARSGN